MTARAVALQALLRIDDGAFANIALPALLDQSDLPPREKAFATELTYGTTRMRRAVDHLLSPFVRGDLDAETQAMLRLGAYQLAFLQTPPHAAVSATVDLAPPRTRGLVNAVLRRVAGALPARYPDPPTRLSYPDWIVQRLATDLGAVDAEAAMVQMNEAPPVTERADGYVQDLASQWVAALVEVEPGDVVGDPCAAPGGKATAMASAQPRLVAAADLQPHRARLVSQNVDALGLDNVAVLVADGTRPPYRVRSFDRVLVDAPCSGLGVLRRRPDARWRVEPATVDRLVVLQQRLIDAALLTLKQGGLLVYSVCTLTRAESIGIDEWLAAAHPGLVALPSPPSPWRPLGRGALLLPQAAGTDGMYVLRLRAP